MVKIRELSIFWFILYFSACRSSSYINDDRILVMDRINVELSFLPQKLLTKQLYNFVFSKNYDKEIDSKVKLSCIIDISHIRDIPMISTYNDTDLTWDQYKALALKNTSLYYLGNIKNEETNLYFLMIESQSSFTLKINKALYMITECKSEKWVIPIALHINEGLESQMLSYTKNTGTQFKYIDFSNRQSIYCSYRIDESGRINFAK